MDDDVPIEDTFRILVATDIHLGVYEKDPARGDDSFNTFEEILQLARSEDVDFILLGGDLFHETKPTSTCMHRCMALLREYCLGDRAISFDFLSDHDMIFKDSSQSVVNYEDPNINVSIPVFSVHGNHDDPTGQNSICTLDILSCAGLVNYFGKSTDLSHLSVNPILLQKGASRLALYGFGHVKDARLYRLFSEGKVTFLQPDEFRDEWFNVCVLHQNRAANRGQKNTIPEDFLPELLDFVIWGHEHDCRIKPEPNSIRDFYITQPGSSVATSLCEGEAIKKQVGILNVHKNYFNMDYFDLKTVRPFVFLEKCSSEFELMDVKKDISEQLEELVEEEVNQMILDAEKQRTDNPKQPKLPLIRLRLFYTDESQMFNTIRFGQRFEDKVVNSGDMILMKRRTHDFKEKRDVLDEEMMKDALRGARHQLLDVKVEDYVKKYFNNVDDDDTLRMNLLTVNGLNEAVSSMVEKNHNSALEEIIAHQQKRMEKYLMTQDVEKENIDELIRSFMIQRKNAGEAEINETRDQLKTFEESAERNGTKTKPKPKEKNNDFVEVPEEDEDHDIEEDDEDIVPSGRGRGRGRGRGARRARAPRAARAPRGSRAASTSAGSRGRGRGTPQRTLMDSFATQASQLSVVRTQTRSNRSRVQFQDSDDSD